MALQLTRPLAIFDLETTGVDVANDRIVSLGAMIVGGATVEHRFNPGRPIPPEATAVHGITDADVADKPRFAEVAHQVYDLLAGCDIAGFNVRAFDVPMLAAEFARVGLTWPDQGVIVVDAFRIYNRKEPRTLGAAVRHYIGQEHVDAHSAAADVEACAQVLAEQATRYGVTTIAELAALESDPDWIDQDGRLRWQGNVACVGFGKWAGRPLAQVEQGYLRWMLGQDFPAELKTIIADALRGRFPTRTP